MVTGNIAVVNGNQNTLVAFNNCSPFTRSLVNINDEHVETSDNIDAIIDLYNLIEYSHNYSDTTGTLLQYKRQEENLNVAGNIDNVNANDSSSFRYKSNLLKGLTTGQVGANVNPDIANARRLFLNAQIAVSLKYLSNFSRSLEMPLINFRLHIELNWTKKSGISNVDTASTFRITNTKLYVPICTLLTKENLKLTKLLSERFKR